MGKQIVAYYQRHQSRLELGDAFVAPRTSIEQTLAEIWTKVLRVERIGINDSFFESETLAQMLAELQQLAEDEAQLTLASEE